MPRSKTTGKDSVHASTMRGAKKIHAPDAESVVRFADGARQRGDGIAEGDGPKG